MAICRGCSGGVATCSCLLEEGTNITITGSGDEGAVNRRKEKKRLLAKRRERKNGNL